MATQHTSNLRIVNGMPAADKLWNGRWRLEFFCDPDNKVEGWYNDNIDKWIPAFGALQDHAIENGWEYDSTGVAYDNMRLVKGGVEYISAANTHYVTLAYETLTSSWVQEKDDTVTYSENGLERVTRVSVALPNTAYTSVVGTTTIDNDGVTLYLANREIDETDAKWTLTEQWLEAGILKESTSGAGDGLVKKSITYLKTEPAVPANHVIISRNIGDYEGLQTITVDYMVLPVDGVGNNKYTYKTTDQFTIPGIVDYERFTDAINTFNYVLDIAPPVPTTIDLNVEVEYTTDGTSSVGSYYQPTFWTKVTISGSTLYNKAFAKTSYHINHIAGSDGIVVSTTSTPEIDAIQGSRLYGGTTGRIQIEGPSDDIAGTEQVLSITRDNIFTTIDGTNYYKKITTTGTIPAR